MILIGGVLETALSIYSFAILARLLLSWVPLRSGTFAYRRIFRRYIPFVRFGNAALDLSPVVGLIVLFIVQRLLVFFL
jgi:uncharacterized protein YggT (Ycf19 family)